MVHIVSNGQLFDYRNPRAFVLLPRFDPLWIGCSYLLTGLRLPAAGILYLA